MAKQIVKVKKTEGAPETVELLAKSIIQVAEGFEKIQKSSLRQRTLVVLLHDCIGAGKVTKSQIRLVLDNIPRLKAWYVKG